MKTFTDPRILRAVLLSLVGFLGGVVAMIWPLGHTTFCSGFAGVLV